MRDVYLSLALGIGLTIGYLVGSREVAPAYPANYDPARAIIGDALRLQTEATTACWRVTVEALERKAP